MGALEHKHCRGQGFPPADGEGAEPDIEQAPEIGAGEQPARGNSRGAAAMGG